MKAGAANTTRFLRGAPGARRTTGSAGRVRTGLILVLAVTLLDIGVQVAQPPAARGAQGAGGWQAVESMHLARSRHTATVLTDGKVLVVGGVGPAGTALGATELYDPATRTWSAAQALSQCAPSPACVAREGHTATRLRDGRVLVVGGRDARGIALASSQLYDPGTGDWAPATALAGARADHTATLLDGPDCTSASAPGWCTGVLIVGGTGADPVLYQPSAAGGTWGDASKMVLRRFGHTATVVAGTVLVTGGEPPADDCAPKTGPIPDPTTATGPLDSRPAARAERYTPPAGGNPQGSWTQTGPAVAMRRDHAAVALSGNTRVLVAGGMGCPADGTAERKPMALASAEIYDAGLDAWRPTDEMATPRARHTSARLSDGKVLVAGGVGRDGKVLASTELFDPEQAAGAGAWSAAEPLVTARADVPAVALAGEVIAVGGVAQSADPTVVSSATERFSAGSHPPSVARLEPPAGPSTGGTAVAVTGTGFTGTPQVRFGDKPATSVRVESATRLVAVAPPQPAETDVAVVVVTAAGASQGALRPARFRYVDTAGHWAPLPSASADRVPRRAVALTGSRCSDNPAPSWCGDVLLTEPPSYGGPERYDHGRNRWEPARVLDVQGTKWSGNSATSLDDGTVLVVGPQAKRYDPAVDSTEELPNPATGRRDHSATRLRDGRVLLAGGVAATGSGLVASAELFSPDAEDEARVWTVAGGLAVPRRGHTASLLDAPACAASQPPAWCGQVLVVGGVGADGAPVASVEAYSPTSKETPWRVVNGTNVGARSGHTATVLGGPQCSGDSPPSWCGKVLVAGGVGPDGWPLSSAELYDPLAGTWTTVQGPLSDARAHHSATVVEGHGCDPHCGKVLVAGGVGASADPLATAELYDPTAGTWRGTAPLRIPRSGHAAAPLRGGRVLAVAGYQRVGEAVAVGRSAEEFHASSSPVVSAVEPPAGSTLDATSVTIRGARLTGARVRFGTVAATTVTQISDSELVAVTPPQAQGTVDVVVEVDPHGASVPWFGSRFTYAAGTWHGTDPMKMSACPPPCGPRYGHTATLLGNGKVLVAGGTEWDRLEPSNALNHDSRAKASLSSAQLYDPATGSWAATGSMSSPRHLHSATLLADGRVLVAGGQQFEELHTPPPAGNSLATAEIYDPGSGTWLPTGPLAVPRASHTATRLDDGRVLAVGGTSDPDSLRAALDSVEVYDAGSGTWSAANPLSECQPDAQECVGRVDHTATLLPNGKVLVAGGFRRFPVNCQEPTGSTAACRLRPLAWAQIYDPRSGTWRATAAMAADRAFHTATLLDQAPCGARCGRVLVVSGLYQQPEGSIGTWGVGSAELFDPVSETWAPTSPPTRPRVGHTATLLPNGTVLVAGAGGVFNEFTDVEQTTSAEVFEPVSGRWRPTSFLGTARGLHTATMLDGPRCRGDRPAAFCGSVLVAGGNGLEAKEVTTTPGGVTVTQRYFPAIDQAEIYTPAPVVTAVEPQSGPAAGATKVAVTGTGFAGATAARFGGTPSSFAVSTPTRLTTTTPAHDPGAVDVEVVNAGGTSATLVPRTGDPRFTYVGAAGRVLDLSAHQPVPGGDVLLSFSAPDDGTGAGAATAYQIRLAESGITDEAAFAAALPLCEAQVCRFEERKTLTLAVGGLDPGTTFHFALRAFNDLGELGPLSNSAGVTTSGLAPGNGNEPPKSPVARPGCPALPPAATGVTYPGRRYALVALPGGTVVNASSPLYRWLDRGARGTYDVQGPGEPVQSGVGYWAWFRCPTVVRPAGPGVDSVQLPLAGYHASMVGNPSGIGPATVSGHDFVARWDAELNDGAGGYVVSGYREPQRVAVGEAVWAFSYQDTTIEVAR